MHLSAGARVRSFEIVGPVGAGGMGAVYRARDVKLGRDVAIKILQDDLSQNREYLHRFEREARAASALNHPNIITIYEINEDEGAPFIAMELVEGSSLRELLKSGPLPVRKLLDVASQIASGLAAAHERGIVHRDLKPENVMVTSDGRVKILDFGLARVNRNASPSDATSEFSEVRTPEGRILGTASYVSPEQAAGTRTVDFRSDQFSFGSLLYELASGRSPFRRNSTVETLAAILREEPEPLQRLNPRIPPQLCWLVERCLSKDPSDRYSSTRDLARELATLRDRLPETSPGHLPLPARWSLRARALGIAVVVIGAGIAIMSASHRFGSHFEQLPNQKYVAVLPFNDRSGRPDGQLFTQGFGEAVSARLSKYSGIQVIPPASAAPLVAKKSSFQRIAQELGATLLLNASVLRNGDTLRVSYTIVDPGRGADVTGDAVDGSVQNVWAAQDAVADAVARDLGIAQRTAPTKHAGLETPEEQDLYIRALGGLEQADDDKALDSAISSLRELTESAGNSALVHAALGRAYYLKFGITHDPQWADKAKRACDRAQAIEPDSPDVLITVGKVETLVGQYERAIAAFTRALALEPDAPDAAIGLAKVYAATHADARAEEQFRRGIRLRPTWWFGHNELGTFYFTRGRYDDAMREFIVVMKLAPGNSWGYKNAGNVLVTRNRLEEAANMFTKATAINGDAGAYSNLGYCYYFLEQYDRAVESDKRAVELQPNNSGYWINLADAYAWSSTSRSQADPAYRRAADLARREISVNADSARAQATLAIALAKTGATAEAQQHMKKALDLQPANPVRMYQAARVAVGSGDTAAAVRWLKRALGAGYQRFEIDHDPEFLKLRSTQEFRALLNDEFRSPA